MCGRYVLHTPVGALAEAFGAVGPLPNFPARYNIAPTQQALILKRDADTSRRLYAARWGLVPGWSQDLSLGARLINARAETLAEKPSFRQAFRARRCLVPADGFYEWVAEGKRRTPLWIRRPDGQPLGLAGLWEVATGPDGARIETFTIITTEARGGLAAIHDRSPVILEENAWATWLAPDATGPVLAALMQPADQGLLISPADPRANSPRNDGPDLIIPPLAPLL